MKHKQNFISFHFIVCDSEDEKDGSAPFQCQLLYFVLFYFMTRQTKRWQSPFLVILFYFIYDKVNFPCAGKKKKAADS